MFVQICYIISYPKFTAEGFGMFLSILIISKSVLMNDVERKRTLFWFFSIQTTAFGRYCSEDEWFQFGYEWSQLISSSAQNVPKHWKQTSAYPIRGSLGYFYVAVQQDLFLQGQPHRRGFLPFTKSQIRYLDENQSWDRVQTSIKTVEDQHTARRREPYAAQALIFIVSLGDHNSSSDEFTSMHHARVVLWCWSYPQQGNWPSKPAARWRSWQKGWEAQISK